MFEGMLAVLLAASHSSIEEECRAGSCDRRDAGPAGSEDERQ